MVLHKYKIAFAMWSLRVAGAYTPAGAQQYNTGPDYNAGIVYNQSDVTDTASAQWILL